MSIFSFFAATKEKQKTGEFARFFLHASEKEKKQVFKDAARRANEDQRALVKNVKELQHKAT
ncbi:MAG: hypothetical protein A3J93_01830 [Candidatus Magasanikbacteria bacterium RIFOXYC2_FULL_42_28]|uniref:Uncharacterized protein n=1 Tax=Candidatus Magasanikbacteria bacterium RIFOXYC2_FULL_42_28 TaxID=1798704 RepID=A0A1F6NY08_9BACT|nr:MAG: hypothetical protein A3J93_01830 [Candidatus Magasanikbacteria bacterium RIFOXYC2_FULL_42_28]